MRKHSQSNDLAFEFRGIARCDWASHVKSEDPEKVLLKDLNETNDSIADAIRRELRWLLPQFEEVEVDIDFKYGSIEWLGVVTILDGASRISGSIALVEYLMRGIQFAVDQVLRNNSPIGRSKTRFLWTPTHVRCLPVRQQSISVWDLPLVPDDVRGLKFWLIANTALSGAIIVLLLRHLVSS